MPAIIDFQGSRIIDAAPETVFDYVADPLNDPDWCPLVLGCEQVKGSGPEEGAVYRWEQAVAEGQSVPMDVRLDTVDRPRFLEWTVENDLFDYNSTMTFQRLPNGGTQITQHNRTMVKVANDDQAPALQEQAEGVMYQQFDNLEGILAAV